MTRLALWALRDARNPERLWATARGWLRAVRELRSSQGGLEALAVISRYFALVTKEEAGQNVLDVLIAGAPALEATMTTLAERWIAEGRAEGEARGRAEGEARGRAEGEARGRTEGQRQVLVQLLTLKFGELPASARERVARAGEAELTHWAARVLSAASLEAVFAA